MWLCGWLLSLSLTSLNADQRAEDETQQSAVCFKVTWCCFKSFLSHSVPVLSFSRGLRPSTALLQWEGGLLWPAETGGAPLPPEENTQRLVQFSRALDRKQTAEHSKETQSDVFVWLVHIVGGLKLSVRPDWDDLNTLWVLFRLLVVWNQMVHPLLLNLLLNKMIKPLWGELKRQFQLHRVSVTLMKRRMMKPAESSLSSTRGKNYCCQKHTYKPVCIQNQNHLTCW